MGAEPSPAGCQLPNIARMGSRVKILRLDLCQQGQVWAGLGRDANSVCHTLSSEGGENLDIELA